MKIGGNLLATQAKTAVVLRDGLQFRADLLAPELPSFRAI